jgi:hypothetical protein
MILLPKIFAMMKNMNTLASAVKEEVIKNPIVKYEVYQLFNITEENVGGEIKYKYFVLDNIGTIKNNLYLFEGQLAQDINLAFAAGFETSLIVLSYLNIECVRSFRIY